MALSTTLYSLALFVCAIAWELTHQERGGLPAWADDRTTDRVQTPSQQWRQQQDYRHDWFSGNSSSRRTVAGVWNVHERSSSGRHGSRQQQRQHLQQQHSRPSRGQGDQSQQQQHHLQHKSHHQLHKQTQRYDKKHQQPRTTWRIRDSWDTTIGGTGDGDGSSSSIGEAWRRGAQRQDRPSGQRGPYARYPQDRHVTWGNPRPERKLTSQHREDLRRKIQRHSHSSTASGLSSRQPWHVQGAQDTIQSSGGSDLWHREPAGTLPEASWRTQHFGFGYNGTRHNIDNRNHLNTHINANTKNRVHGASQQQEQEFRGRNQGEAQQGHGFGTKRPNIVLIITDDQDVELGSLNYMPKLRRRMRDGGAMLPNAYTSTPMCCPSRSSLLTGMYIHNHEVYTNNQNCSSVRWQQTHERRTFATYLNDAGYRTGYFGKYLNKYNGSHVPAGWREWAGLLMNSKYYNYTVNRNSKKVKYGERYPQDYYPRVITEDGVEFIRTSKSMASHPPFMMVLSYPAPHGPEDSAPEYSHLFFNATDHHTVAYDYAPNPDKQWILQNTDRMDDIQLKFTDVLMTKRLQTLQSIDDAVERIYEELEAFGELNNTYIFYTSDHGYHLGQFGLVKGKSMPFEFDIKVPFFVSGPDISPGIILPNIALNIDLAPTFLDIAGIPIPPHMDGRSLIPLFQQSSSPYRKKYAPLPWRDSFLVESSGRYREDPLSWSKRKLDRARGYSGIGDIGGSTPTLYTSKHERLEIVCKRPEFQSPCKRFQKWECISDGRRWRLQKCRPKRGGRVRNCMCDSNHGMGYLVKLEPEERKKQRAFLNKHATQDIKMYKPKFLKVFNDVDSQEIAETTLMETGFYGFNKNSKRSVPHKRDRKGKEHVTPRRPAGCRKGRCKRSTHNIDQEIGDIDKSIATESIGGDTISDFINEEELRDIDDQIIEIYGELETLEDEITTTVPPTTSFNMSTVLSPDGTKLGMAHGCRASGGEVDCMEEVYNNPTTWKSSKAAIDDYIQLLHQQLQVLKNIRQHLREKRPHNNEESENSEDYIFDSYDSEEDGMESGASGDSLFTIDDIFEFGSGDAKRMPDLEGHEDKVAVTELPTDAKDIDFFDEVYNEKEFSDYSVEYGDDFSNSSEITIDEEVGGQVTVTENDGEVYFKDYDYDVEDDGISGFGATQETGTTTKDKDESSYPDKKVHYGSRKHFNKEKPLGINWSDLFHLRRRTEDRNERPNNQESRLGHDLGFRIGQKHSKKTTNRLDHMPSQFHISFPDPENRRPFSQPQDPSENETSNDHICWCNRRQAVRLARLAEREKKRSERQQLREARRQRKEKKIRKKTQNNLEQCLIPMLNCYTHDNEHWRTPPLWTDGPFCFCMNAANNTYWCLRTINSTHNFLYCEFITGLVTYYDMNIDPYQLRNVAFTLTTDLLEELHGRLETLRMCVGVDQCDSIPNMPQVESTLVQSSAASVKVSKNEKNSIANGIEGRIDVMSSVLGKGKLKKTHSRESHKNRRRKQKFLKKHGYDDGIVYSVESGSSFDPTDSRRHRVRLPRKSKVKKQNRRREKRRERRKKRKERKSAVRQRRF